MALRALNIIRQVLCASFITCVTITHVKLRRNIVNCHQYCSQISVRCATIYARVFGNETGN